ncbi:hypothetical protein [Microbacterium sulfonylureivorans]|uniref:hypothetical protein n=1 Tax=Microbacterium sulfonylureivorans TaxID=2486854 RepID=UPI000FD83304|nr:hypothetical protein [Microbacterium sulfonylureivorans]
MVALPPWMDGVPFSLAQGREAGLSDAVMRRRGFERPHWGVRVAGAGGRSGDDFVDRCWSLRVALPPDALLSHATAARLWGMPLPPGIPDELHVLTEGTVAVRRRGVVGWRRSSPQGSAAIVHGLPVTTPADTWVSLATMTAGRGRSVGREWLVATADFLVSGRRTRFGREAALATMDDLAAALRTHGSRRGAALLRWALPRVRTPVDSPPETLLRLGLVRERLPEPAVQPAVLTAAGVRHPDLGYIERRVLLEYLGDVHRSDRRTWLQDLQRVRLFEDQGFRVVLVGAADLSSDGLRLLSAHVRRLLA